MPYFKLAVVLYSFVQIYQVLKPSAAKIYTYKYVSSCWLQINTVLYYLKSKILETDKYK